MPPTAAVVEVPESCTAADAVAEAARCGLTASPKWLPPWLFYDEAGSRLFEEITALPEYYPTRTERDLFRVHAGEIFGAFDAELTIAELGAGTAAKTGILLRALMEAQAEVLYQPIDISPSSLEEARDAIERTIPGVTVRPQVANYISEAYSIERPVGARVLALYIGSSIGNFSPAEANDLLRLLHGRLRPGDALLLGADLAPGRSKPVATMLAAYDDAAGVTAAFNRNVLTRLDRELGADFEGKRFTHRAVWNAAQSRMEMHLESPVAQTVRIPANAAGEAMVVEFAAGETIHTENSYKFTRAAIDELLAGAGFATMRRFADAQGLFAVTLAGAV